MAPYEGGPLEHICSLDTCLIRRARCLLILLRAGLVPGGDLERVAAVEIEVMCRCKKSRWDGNCHGENHGACQ